MLTAMEPEPEVMGTPGRVRDMIARFSDLATPPSANSVTKSNGTSPTSPTDCDVTDNLIREPAEVRQALKPVNRDLGFGEPTHINNNDKIFRHELDTHPSEQSEYIKDSDNSLMNFRKKLRPVANSVIVTDTCVGDGNDVTNMDSEVTSPVTANGSEPSLLSRNGQRSSVTASKRTLVSQDTDPSPQKVDIADHRASSQPTLLDTGMPATTTMMTSDMGYDAVETTTPKTPSYMKISCALSGYNRYNTYTSPKQEAKLKVLKMAGGEQNGSHSSLSSQQSDSSSSAAPAEIRTSSDLNIKVVNDEHTTTTTTTTHEPMRNGVTNGEKLLNGSCSNGGDATTINGAHPPVAIVTNGRTGGVVGDDLDDDQDKFVTKAMVKLQPSGSPTTMPELRLPLEDKLKAEQRSAVSTPSPSKDGYYYFPVLDREVARIRNLCIPCEAEIASNSLPEEACGKMRAAVGKANLLVNKKFEQFRGLCEQNINQSHNEAFRTTVTDLAGFWDMVSLQITDIDQSFVDIEKMRQSGWKVVKDSPVKQPSVTLKGGTKKSPRGKDTSTTSSTPSKSAKSEEASRARDEARKRLLAAKRAGRQRKASQSDKDEIEIFVAE